jgi:hypothetical protein
MFVLGRAVSRSAWGGVIAALLTVVVSEVSFARNYNEPMFLGLFVRWLFVSPTFFFGIIFCGALLIVIGRYARQTRCGWRERRLSLRLVGFGVGLKASFLLAGGAPVGTAQHGAQRRARRQCVHPGKHEEVSLGYAGSHADRRALLLFGPLGTATLVRRSEIHSGYDARPPAGEHGVELLLPPPLGRRVFYNARMEVYRLSEFDSPPGMEVAAADGSVD